MTGIEIVRALYEAFAARDRARILTILHPQIEWNQNEGFPGGGKHLGAAEVLDGVFARFGEEWQDWRAGVNEWIDAGETVIALGQYHGTARVTGRSMRAAFAHIYRVREGRIVRFDQYTDTLMVVAALQPSDGKNL